MHGMGMGKGKCSPAMVAFWLMVVGGLNWGLVGLGGFMDANWNLVYMIFGSMPWLENLVYLLVGVSTVIVLVGCKCKTCKDGACGCGPSTGAMMGQGPKSSM